MHLDNLLWLTIATIMLSAFVQSVTGFGFGLVAMALLPLLAAVFVGNRVLRKLQHQHLRLAVFVFLFLIGVKYAAKF